MPLWPDDNYIGDNARTEAEGKAWFEQLRDAGFQLPGAYQRHSVTISAGVITPYSWIHTVNPESGTADDLTNISDANLVNGRVVVLCTSSGNTITVKHNAGGAGQIAIADDKDFVLDHLGKYLALYNNWGAWTELFRCYADDSMTARADLGLGTVATLDTGTASGEVPLLGADGLPAVSGENLTGINRREIIAFVRNWTSPFPAETITKGVYVARRLTDITLDETGAAVLLPGGGPYTQMQIPAGKYFVEASCHLNVNGDSGTFHTRLHETSSAITPIRGGAEYVLQNDTKTSLLSGYFEIAATGTFELQVYATSTAGTFLGETVPEDVTAQVEFQRLHI